MLLILGFLFVVFTFTVLVIWFHFSAVYIFIPSLLMLLFFIIFFLLVSKSGKMLIMYIKTSFKKEYTYTKTELESISLAIKSTIKFTLASGIFGFITFIVICLANLESREVLGPALAMSLTSLTYSIAISYFILFPTQVWAENKIIQNF